MKFYYRISDKSYPKIKLPGTSKKMCLENFIECFMPMKSELTIVADNCSPERVEWLKTLDYTIVETSLGNAGALLYSIRLALEESKDNPRKIAYFVEDDYLHDVGRATELMYDPMISIPGMKAPYWTLFDHPDKYSKLYNYGESCKVCRTKKSHWRQTISTTMTFVANLLTLQEDLPVWEEYLADVQHPPDHNIFLALNEKGRNLISPIPGAACHMDMTHSGSIGTAEFEPFAIKYVYDRLYKKLQSIEGAVDIFDEMIGQHSQISFTNLIRLAALLEGFNGEVESQ